MGVRLGAGYRPPVPPASIVEPEIDTNLLILNALMDLREQLVRPAPAPAAVVLEPDLTDIVTAVNGLKPGATPDQIAEAIVHRLQPPTVVDSSGGNNETLARVADALVLLEHRLQGISYQAYGGGAVALQSGQTIGISGAIPETSGVYSYAGGTSGTVTPPVGAKVRGIACHATTAATVTIKGGNSIPVPANTTFFDSPEQLVGDGAWTLVFTGTDNYYVRYL